MNINWFLSRTVRHANHMGKHVQKILDAQRDLLPPPAIEAVSSAIVRLQETTRKTTDKKVLLQEMGNLEKVANERLKHYPNASIRENIEVLLVAIAVAMAIRTFFLQPFKIPTGSMQPTLYGITEENLLNKADEKIPNPISRFFTFWFRGVQYKHVVAKADGMIDQLSLQAPPKRFLLFNLYQSFRIGDATHTVWFPPDSLWARAGLLQRMNQPFKKGDDVIRLRVFSGDHLFVDRLTYNFRRPKLGDIVVFETQGIQDLPPGQFYIKRLVGLGNDRVRLGNDRHLIINGKRLDEKTPHFEKVYSFDHSRPPIKDQYSGHVNETVANQNGYYSLARNFPDENHDFVIPPNHYIVMGDNTMNSSDSRTWGAFPQERVIGKSFFVYWPIGSQDGRGSRFGVGVK